jgi:hypothetical protein
VITADDVCRSRLAGQFLTAPGPSRANAVVRALGAVQAQDYAGAKWALGQRTRTLTDTDVEREFEAGDILRTHVLRPTWHFVSPSDIRWMLALTGPRVCAAMAHYNRKLELDRSVFRRSNAVLTRALRDGKCLTRAELRTALDRAGVEVGSGQRLGHLMMQGELDGVLCSGPRRGKQFTYALLDERAPMTTPLDRDEALLELTRRYFTTRGPATTHDFAWWSGLTLTDVKRGIDLAGKQLERVTLGEGIYWRFASTSKPPRKSTAHLLPNYDEYFIGHRDRSVIAQHLGDTSAVTGGNALISYVVIVDGQLVGTWRRRIEKDRVVVTVDPLTHLSATERARVAAAANGFGKFLQLPVELRRAE